MFGWAGSNFSFWNHRPTVPVQPLDDLMAKIYMTRGEELESAVPNDPFTNIVILKFSNSLSNLKLFKFYFLHLFIMSSSRHGADKGKGKAIDSDDVQRSRHRSCNPWVDVKPILSHHRGDQFSPNYSHQ